MLKKYDSKDYPNLEITMHECIDDIVIINQWYQACLENIDWVEGEIKIFGKTHKIPRLQAWYADKGINYKYSGKTLKHNYWNKDLIDIKSSIEALCKCTLIQYWQIFTEMVQIQWDFILMTKKNLGVTPQLPPFPWEKKEK